MLILAKLKHSRIVSKVMRRLFWQALKIEVYAVTFQCLHGSKFFTRIYIYAAQIGGHVSNIYIFYLFYPNQEKQNDHTGSADSYRKLCLVFVSISKFY